MMNLIDRLLKKTAGLAYGFGVYVMIPLLVILITVDVTMRYGLNTPLAWGNEISALMLLLVFFGTLPYCTHRQGHIRMDLLHNKFGAGMKRFTEVLAALSGLLFSVLLLFRTAYSTLEMHEWNEGAEMIDVPYWPFMAFVCLGSGVLTLMFILQLLKALFFRTSEMEAD